MPAISVLMPVYNAAATLGPAVSSITEQTESEWELLAVDDGSTDESAAILEAFAAKDRRIRVLRRVHTGIVSALNTGLEAAKGSLIARMDADDLAAPTRLEKQRRFLAQNPEIGVAGSLVRFGGNAEENAGYAAHVDWTNTLVTPDELSVYRFVEAPLAHPSVMFHLDLTYSFGAYQEGTFPEDYELWLRWMDKGVRFGKVPEPLLCWNDPPTRLSRTDDRYDIDAFYRVKSRYLARWLARHNPHHPSVMVVGSGRVTRRRVDMLVNHGVEVTAYIDIDPKKVGRKHNRVPVISPGDVPPAGKHFVLAYVGKRGAREFISGWLSERGYKIGRDWLPAA